MNIPLHSYDLIKQLAESVPEVIYAAGIPHDEQLLRFGERRLVKSLLLRMQREIEDQTNVLG